MLSMTLNALTIFLHRVGESVPAMLITVAAGVLITCAVCCTSCGCKSKDRLFDREVY